MDKSKINKFWESRTGVSDPRLATNYRNDGRLDHDIALVREYANPRSHILDLGAGTCTLSEALLRDGCYVDAVEKFQGFLDKAISHPSLNKIVCDIKEFAPAKKYDVILIFGVINFLDRDEEIALYGRCAEALQAGGTLIVKNQCGIDVEKVVDGFSDELAAAYHARYPAVRAQKELLSKFFNVSVRDIYPPELNRWADTHFYAFVCSV